MQTWCKVVDNLLQCPGSNLLLKRRKHCHVWKKQDRNVTLISGAPLNFLLLGRLSKYVFFISKTLARKHFMLEHELIYELWNCHFCRVQVMVKSPHPASLVKKNTKTSVNQICVIPYSRPIFAGIFMDIKTYLLFWINVGLMAILPGSCFGC